MDPEKKDVRDSSASSVARSDPLYHDEELVEPPKENSLHRGLKARQISMIAVCDFPHSIMGSELI